MIDIDLRLLDLLQQKLGMTIENEARFGRNDPVIAAKQELVLEVALQRGDLLRERGLRRPQEASCARDAAGVDDLNKALQLPEIDAHMYRTLFLNRKAAGYENTIWIGTILYLAY